MCLALAGDACLSQSPLWAMTVTICKDSFTHHPPNWVKHKKNGFKGGDSFNLIRQLIPLTLYVLRLEQCVQMLGYNKGQVLEHFKNSLPTRLLLVVWISKP